MEWGVVRLCRVGCRVLTGLRIRSGCGSEGYGCESKASYCYGAGILGLLSPVGWNVVNFAASADGA